MLENFKGWLEDVRSIVNAPVVNIMLLFGFLLVVLSFLRLDGLETLSLTGTPNLIMLVIGIILLFGGPVLFVFTRENRRINKKVTIKKGLSFLFDKLSVHLRAGKIQEVPELNKDSAVVLPANTTFIDDCITDPKSALGAFFLKFYPDKIPEIASQTIEKELEKQGYQKDEDNSYPPGTTIVLPPEYHMPAKCIITASTIRKERVGIWAFPSTICECVRQIFETTADKKIEKLHMPVLGSGHGGLDINDALLFLLLALKYYSKRYHHIKLVNIIVAPTDVSKLKDIYRLQYLSFLEVREK